MKYYCDYCDTYLTHDSPSVRKTHCNGRKHKENVRLYYQKWLEEQVQKLVDDTTAAFKAGKIASNPFQQGGAGGGGGGAMIPPPGAQPGKPPSSGPNPGGGPMGGPMPGGGPMGGPMSGGGPMPLMGGPMQGGPMPPMMQVGMRPQMGPMMGPPMHAMGAMGVRPGPLIAGPAGPPAKMQRKS